MFHVVEFSSKSGGGLGLIRNEWLTPRKKECFWPPHKLSLQFNKALMEGHAPDETWPLCEIEREFYNTDDIIKAREKLKQAECESDLQTDGDFTVLKRKRKAVKKLYECTSSENEEDVADKRIRRKKCSSELNEISFYSSLPPEDNVLITPQDCDSPSQISPTPGKTFGKTSSTPSGGCNSSSMPASIKTPEARTHFGKSLNSSTFANGLMTANKTIASPGASIGHSSSSGTSTSFEVIARHLASIESRLTNVYENQLLILQRLDGLPVTNVADGNHLNSIPNDINKPCSTEEDVNNLEKWLEIAENEKSLESSLSLRGGKNVKVIVHRILSKLFTNELAANYNWTGKFNKKPLKNLKIIEVIQHSVRRNPHTPKASDLEITTAIINWFRFVKDRDGGRERRRPIRPAETP